MEEYFKLNIFGLSEKQINVTNKEIEKFFNNKDLNYYDNYKDENDEIKINKIKDLNLNDLDYIKCINYYFSLKINKDLFTEFILDIDLINNLSYSLIELKYKNQDFNDIFKEINKLSMNILERTFNLKTIVGLYKVNLIIRKFFN